MSRVIVADNDGRGHTYDGATGANYDDRGFLTVVTGKEPDTEAMAVSAPGRWQKADLDNGESHTQQEPSA